MINKYIVEKEVICNKMLDWKASPNRCRSFSLQKKNALSGTV